MLIFGRLGQLPRGKFPTAHPGVAFERKRVCPMTYRCRYTFHCWLWREEPVVASDCIPYFSAAVSRSGRLDDGAGGASGNCLPDVFAGEELSCDPRRHEHFPVFRLRRAELGGVGQAAARLPAGSMSAHDHRREASQRQLRQEHV